MLQDFNHQSKMRQAQAFIRGKQFLQAREVLETLDNPEARRLLHRLKNHMAGMDNMGLSSSKNHAEPNLRPLHYRRYWQVRILSYGVRFIALVWAIVGLMTYTGVSPNSAAVIGVTALAVNRQDAALIILGQAFFMYVAGAVMDLLADMATNQALIAAIMNDE